jgi:hypothetical protein
MQSPPTQLSPPPQARPHDPQWLSSLEVSTHEPPQSVVPPAQSQLPLPEQLRPAAQLPHEPPQPSSPQARPPQLGMQPPQAAGRSDDQSPPPQLAP